MVISMIPLAPFSPYFAFALSPFKIFMDLISFGLISFMFISEVMTPSMTMSGFSLGEVAVLPTFSARNTKPLGPLNSTVVESIVINLTSEPEPCKVRTGGVGGAGAAAGGGGGGISRVATENTFLPVLGSEKVVESGRIVTVNWVTFSFLAFGFCALNWMENKAKIKANMGNTATFLR